MQDSYEKYNQYTVGDFVMDEEFIASLNSPDEANAAFWDRFLEVNPHKAETINEAKKLVAALKVKRETVSQDTRDRVLEKVKRSFSSHKVVRLQNGRWWIAAASVLFLVATIAFFQYRPQNEIIQTAQGEKRTIVLPDASTVVLNAASKIEYKKRWTSGMAREVWIDGEAYFDVVHKNKAGTAVQPSERFIVHLKNMDIEVLGTTFTVTTLPDQEQVVLQTGSIKISLKDKKEEVYLKPGEMIRYTASRQDIKKEVTTPEDHSLWKDNKIKFNNTSLRDIARHIEENYGYKVEITDTSLLNRTFAGTLSSENEDILFKALEAMLDVKIVVNNKTVTISKK